MDKFNIYYVTHFASLFVLLCLNMFFSLCETSFSSLNRIKLKSMADKNKRARLVLKMLEAHDKLLSSILIGNTFVNIVSSALATYLFVGLFGAKGVSLAAILLTIVVLVFCEISPKTLAKDMPERTALRVAPLLRFIMIFLTPLNFLAAVWTKIVAKVFPPDSGRSVTEDELLTFVEEVRQEGVIDEHEEEMIRHVIEFDDITADEIVTPRVDVIAASENDTADEIGKKFAGSGFSRLPIYRDNIDNITGVILFKDFYHKVINEGMAPEKIVKPVVFVSKTMKISALLRTFQEKQAHMAVLVDEFGGTLGIVTIEDIVEELVGEIWDEHENVVEPFKQNADGSFTVICSANIEDMFEFIESHQNDYSDEEQTDDDHNDEGQTDDGDFSGATVGSWVMDNTSGLPYVGVEFVWRNLHVRISRVQRHRVIEIVVACLKQT